jgi:hypothetical protein
MHPGLHERTILRFLSTLCLAWSLAMLGGCKTGASAGNGQPQPLSENSGALHMEGCDWKPDATLAGRGGEGGAVATWEWASGGASGKSLAPRVVSIPTANEDTYNLYWDTKIKFSDVALEVRVQARTGEIDQGGGPIWRVQDRDHYYICRVNPLESNFRLYKVVGGVRRQLASVKYEPDSVEPGTWHTIRVTHIRDQITCSLDNKHVLEAKDTAILNAGGVGVWTKADAVTAFEGFSVRRILW